MFLLSLNDSDPHYSEPLHNRVYIIFCSAGSIITPSGEWKSYLKGVFCYYDQDGWHEVETEDTVHPELTGVYFYTGWQLADDNRDEILSLINENKSKSNLLSERE
jgi:hypothetical protein